MTPTTPSPISDQPAGEPAKLAKDLEDEQTYLASCRDMCSQDDELPRWERLQRAINYLRALSTDTAHSAIYISKRLTGSDADASFVQAHINQAVSEAMGRSTAPTTGSAPVAYTCDFGAHQKLSFVPLEGANEHRALIYADAAPASRAASVLDTAVDWQKLRGDVLSIFRRFQPATNDRNFSRFEHAADELRALLAASMGGDRK